MAKIIHPDTGGIADVPESSLPHHYRAGWRPLAGDGEPRPEAGPEPEPMTEDQAARAAASSETGPAESEEQ